MSRTIPYEHHSISNLSIQIQDLVQEQKRMQMVIADLQNYNKILNEMLCRIIPDLQEIKQNYSVASNAFDSIFDI